MVAYPLKPSFAGGEITPALYGRTDLQKYDVSAAKIENAIVLRFGGVTRRPGFRYIAPTKNQGKARLIPFMYSTEQNYVLEFTAGKVRFFTQGAIVLGSNGQPYEVSTSYTEEELATIKYAQSADVLFLVQPNHAPSTLTRYGVNDWRFSIMNIKDGPFEDLQTEDISITTSDTEGNINLYTDAAYFKPAMVGRNLKISHLVPSQYKQGAPSIADNTTVKVTRFKGTLRGKSGNYGTFTGTAVGTEIVLDIEGASTRAFNETGTWEIMADFDGTLKNAASGTTTLTNTNIDGEVSNAVLRAVGASDSDPQISFTGTVTGSFTGKSKGSTYTKKETRSLQVSVCPHASVYIETSGFWNGTLKIEKEDADGTWTLIKTQRGLRNQNFNFTYTNDSDEIRDYRVTSSNFNNTKKESEASGQTGAVSIQSTAYNYYGIVRITKYISSTECEGQVIRRLGDTKSTMDFALDAWDGDKGYPAAVGFFEDRLIFAGSKAHPQTYWTSKTGDFYNFGTSSPSLDTDAITGTISNGQMNIIKAIVPFGEIVMLTSGGEYRVGGGSQAFTPQNQQAKAQEYRGINDLTPVVVGSRIVYVQRQGTIVRDLAYSYDVDKYTGDDLSLLAAHLFDSHKITGITYQQTPDSVVWLVREDGTLLGMTYVKEQEVFAWHRHTTQGKFVDVCAVGGENEDEVYACIERNGKHYIEQMGSLIEETDVKKQFFVDAGYYYKGVATNTLTGLSWLAGKEVSVLADGNVVKGLSVDSTGKLTLEHPFENIIVGLAYTTDIETLPIELSGENGTTASRKKRIQNMCVLFKNCRSGLYGYNGKKLDEIKWRTTENWNDPIRLFTGKRNISLPQANYGETLQLLIRQKDPLPMTILAIIPEVLM